MNRPRREPDRRPGAGARLENRHDDDWRRLRDRPPINEPDFKAQGDDARYLEALRRSGGRWE